MRSLPDDIPCNLVLVREPEQDTVPRHMRLPSYEAMVTKQLDEERKRKIHAFNTDKYDPHITEADCRKKRVDVTATMAPLHVTLEQGATYRFSLPQSNVGGTLVGPGTWRITGSGVEEVKESTPKLISCNMVGESTAPGINVAKSPRPKADPEGWIKHDGKGIPVSGETMVLVRHRSGVQTSTPNNAAFWHGAVVSGWVDDNSPIDIVAYRMLPD